MATLTVQEIALAGITPTYGAAAAGGDVFANDGKTFYQVKNSGVETTLTFTTPGKVGGVAISDPTVVVPATTGDKMIGPFEPSVFNNAAGQVAVTYTQVTGITVAAVRVP